MTSDSSRRASCAACLRAQSGCICGFVRHVALPTALLILQHPLEVDNAKNSARLLHLSVQGSVLAVGEAFDPFELDALLHAGGRTPVLLYPETPGACFASPRTVRSRLNACGWSSSTPPGARAARCST
jgi:DTW domain-containing protein YfiP